MNALHPLRILLVTSLVVVLAPTASALGLDISANADVPAPDATGALAGVQGTATGLVGEIQGTVEGELDGALAQVDASIGAAAPEPQSFVDKAMGAVQAAFEGIAAFAQGLAARVEIGASA